MGIKDKITAMFKKSDSKAGSKDLILVTGGTGFVATWVIHAFLSHGYRVRTTVRSAAKAEQVKETHKQFADHLEFAIVGDITTPGAHDEAVKGVQGVIHTASPFVLSVEDNKKDLLDPAIKGTLSILESVAKHAPQVKRVVITSSFASILDLNHGTRPGYTYSEKDWNPVTEQEAEVGNGAVAYCASKALAEKAAHDFVKEHKASFSVAAVCPPMIYGPLAQKTDLEHLNTSAADIWRFLDGSLKDEAPPAAAFPAFADVRDVALAHLRAYEKVSPGAEMERYLITSGTFSNGQVCKILRDAFPTWSSKIPDPAKEEPAETFNVDHSKAKSNLGIDFISLEECIKDTGKSLIDVYEASEEKTEYDGRAWLA